VEQIIMDAMLTEWSVLNRDMHTLREDQIKALLDQECRTGKRKVFIERLHQRYSKLRTARERLELLESIK
jgi:hypothetical protein